MITFDAIQFLSGKPDAGVAYFATYRMDMVLVSILTAVFSSYAALIASSRARHAPGFLNGVFWGGISAFTMGIGVWAMHFIGMLSLILPCGIAYDPVMTLVSILPGIVASVFALGMTGKQRRGNWSLPVGSVLLGAGIGTMHYIGMAAMRLEGFIRYDPGLFFSSIMVAILLAYIALYFRVHLQDNARANALVALIIGGAISGMHYTAMAATYFMRSDAITIPPAAIGTQAITIAIVIAAGAVALLTLAFSSIATHRDIAVANVEFQQYAFNLHAIVSITDVQGKIIHVNDKFCEISGYSREELLGENHRIVKSGAHQDEFYRELWQTISNGNVWHGEICNRSKSGSFYWVYSTIVPRLDKWGKPWQYLSFRTDITDRKHAELRQQHHNQALQMLAANVPLAEVLETVARDVETANPAMLCSILLLDDDSRLHHGAAPSLPGFYRQAIDGIVIGPGIGSCCTAAFTGARVIVEDIQTHPWWTPFLDLASRADLRACWSQPIFSAQGKVLGTFAIYHRQVSRPSHADLQLIEDKARLAALVIETTRAEAALRESENRFRLMFERSADVLLLLDSKAGCFIDYNQAAADMLGFMGQEKSILQHLHPAELSPPYQPDGRPSGEKAEEMIAMALRNGSHRFEWIHRSAYREDFPVEVLLTPVMMGERPLIITTWRDITERKKAEEALQLASMVYENSGEAMLVTDADVRIIAVNPAFEKMTGYLVEEVRGKNPRIFKSDRQDEAFYQAMWQSLNADGCWRGELWDKRKNGEVFAVLLTINTIKNNEGAVFRYVALFNDVTERKRLEALMWSQANFDVLTRLPNRHMFHDRLEQEAKKSHRAGLPMALMLIDLDHFKEVNDTLGHDKGDILLIEAARRISNCVRESDTVARLGGDEFIVILSELDDVLSAERIAQHIVSELVEPFTLGADSVYISASIGISLYPNDSTDLEILFKNADQAMYVAKNAGRNRFSYFTPALQDEAQKRLHLIKDLRSALAGEQFRVYYQPIVELSSGRICKAEALLRWQHPERGMISPQEFIPLAEETGLIVPIGDWIFRQAVQQVGQWRSQYHSAFQISVNKSPVQLQHDDGAEVTWPAYLQQRQISGDSITIEITEGLLLSAESGGNDKLLRYRNAGIQVAIDDFGTGYSSLSYLKKFHIDYLKIDQSFVRDLEVDTNDLALCEAIIVMAHKLGLKVIAEGVETVGQHDLLMAAKCDYAQGYLFSRPVPPEEFELLFRGAI